MVLASRRLSSSPGVQPCTRPSWNNPEKLLSRNTPGCSASKACCCVALQESVVVKVPTKFRSNLHRKSKEPSNVQAIICSLCSMWRSSKFAINVYVYRVTETYLNPLSLLRNVFIITFTKLDQNIPMFYKKQDLYHFAQERLMSDDVKACEFLLSQHRGLKLTETLCSSYEQRTRQKWKSRACTK